MRLSDRASAALSRLGGLSGAALAFLLVLAVVRLPVLISYVRISWPVIRLWADPEAQRRQAALDYPYDLLRQADALLPAQATVLLVTPAEDVRRTGYTTFHRALYYLAPRPVWWLSPAPPDGAWESRWWISAPATPESIRAIAAEKRADYVLLSGVPSPAGLGPVVAEWPNGALVQLEEGGPPAAPLALRTLDAGPLWPLQIGAAGAVLFALGYGLLGLAERLGCAVRGVEVAALAWVLGAGGASLALFCLNGLGLGLRGQVAVVTGLAVAALALRLRRYRAPTENRFLDPVSLGAPRLRENGFLVAIALLALFIAQAGLVALLAAGQPLTVWDSWANWGVKARTLFIDNGITPAVTSDPSRAVTHLDYPPMLPLLQAWLYAFLGAPDDRFAGLIALGFYLALAGLVYGGAKRLGAGQGAALAAAVAAASIPQVALLAGFAFADVPLAALAVTAAVFLIGWLAGGSIGTLALAAVAAGLLPWLKREGWVLLAALVLAALIAGRGSRRGWQATGALLGAAAILAGPWLALAARAAPASPDFLPLGLDTFLANMERLPVVATLALANLLSPDWLFVWPLAVLFGVYLILQRFSQRPSRTLRFISLTNILPLSAVFYLAALGLAFVLSAYVPFPQHVLSAWYRLAVHVAPLLVLWIAGHGGQGQEAQASAAAQPPRNPQHQPDEGRA